MEIGIHRLGNKFICDVHSDLSEVFSHVLEHNTHHPFIRFYISRMIKKIEGARTVELQGGCHTAGLRLRLFQEFLVQVLQQRRFSRGNSQGLLPVDQPHTAVNHRLFNGLQAVFAAHHQLAQGQQKIRFHGKRAFSGGHVKFYIHRV